MDAEHGVAIPRAASFDNLQPIRKAFLTERIGALATPRQAICRTLAPLAELLKA